MEREASVKLHPVQVMGVNREVADWNLGVSAGDEHVSSCCRCSGRKPQHLEGSMQAVVSQGLSQYLLQERVTCMVNARDCGGSK